jgi:predicted GNAT family acetyltransferase
VVRALQVVFPYVCGLRSAWHDAQVLGSPTVHLLADGDRPAVLSLLDADPVTTVTVAARIHEYGLSRRRLGADVWGYPPGGPIQSLLWSGANLVPVGASAGAVHAFSAAVRSAPRACSSIVGEANAVLGLWADLSAVWAPAREVRANQPLLATRQPAVGIIADPYVRRARPADLAALLPACIAMYTEEVGVSPMGADNGRAYRARVDDLVRAGRSYLRLYRGEVVFKAEIGAVSPYACQVQGVWVDPRWRGRGIATAGMAAVLADALRWAAPVVSLYVNDFNTSARAVYERCGFHQVGEFATVLF